MLSTGDHIIDDLLEVLSTADHIIDDVVEVLSTGDQSINLPKCYLLPITTPMICLKFYLLVIISLITKLKCYTADHSRLFLTLSAIY